MSRFGIRDLSTAGSFDGTAFVDFGNVYDKERTDSFSFSFWFYATGNVLNQVIFQKRDLANEGYTVQYSVLDNAIRLTMEGITGGQQLNTDSEAVFTVNKWHFVTITYDGTSLVGGVNFYRNGKILTKVANTNTLASNITNTTDFRFGARDGGQLPLTDGMITDWRIHNAELTAAQVLDGYENNSFASVQDRVYFNEGSGQTVTSDNALAGAGTNLLWETTNVPPYINRTAITVARTAIS